MLPIQTISTPKACPPGGHYSQAIVHNKVVYVAGQLAIDQNGEKHPEAPIETQTELALNNIRAILEASGSDLSKVLQMTIYVSDIENWGKVNEVYSRMMGNHKPARAVVPVPELHYGLKIEIQAIAAVG